MTQNPNVSLVQDARLAAGIKALGLNVLPVCTAPVASMNFDTTGRATPCCYNREFELGRYPQNSLKEIWFNQKRQTLGDALNRYDFDKGCFQCKRQILIQNDHLLLNAFRKYRLPNENGYPSHIDFEFANVCNYECIMCGGKWSSSIRRNREKLPPLPSPFDDLFLKQLDEFIPHLKSATFVGGEPFLCDLYFKMWERMSQLNRNITIDVVSNCSVYNSKVEAVLGSLPNMKIIASMDSVRRETYERIRKNGKFEVVLKNLERYIAQKRLTLINCCTLIQNIDEVPEMIAYCEKHNLYVNFIYTADALGCRIKGIHADGWSDGAWNGEGYDPVSFQKGERLPEFRLSTLSVKELTNIKSIVENTQQSCREYLKGTLQGLLNQIQGYIDAK